MLKENIIYGESRMNENLLKYGIDVNKIGICDNCGKKLPLGGYQSYQGLCFDCMGV